MRKSPEATIQRWLQRIKYYQSTNDSDFTNESAIGSS